MAKTEKSLERVLKIPRAPIDVKGLHDWLLKLSMKLLTLGYDKEEVKRICYIEGLHSAQTKGRSEEHWRKEVDVATEREYNYLLEHPYFYYTGAKWDDSYEDPWASIEEKISLGNALLDRRDNRPQYLPLDVRRRERVLRRYKNARPLSELGKVRFRDLAKIYGDIDDFNVCMAQNVRRPVVRPISWWLKRNWWDMELIVPSPMLEPGSGGDYKRDLMTSRRMYQVIEFDEGSLDDQYKLILWLVEKWPLAMLIFSGHKSLHAWFPCFHLDERDIRTFFLDATSIGADHMLRIPSQYCRVPGGFNQKHKRRQSILYLDMDLIEEHNELIQKESPLI